MYSRLSRCSDRASSTRLSPVSPPKVKACKSFLTIEKFTCIEIKDFLGKSHLKKMCECFLFLGFSLGKTLVL